MVYVDLIVEVGKWISFFFIEFVVVGLIVIIVVIIVKIVGMLKKL